MLKVRHNKGRRKEGFRTRLQSHFGADGVNLNFTSSSLIFWIPVVSYGGIYWKHSPVYTEGYVIMFRSWEYGYFCFHLYLYSLNICPLWTYHVKWEKIIKVISKSFVWVMSSWPKLFQTSPSYPTVKGLRAHLLDTRIVTNLSSKFQGGQCPVLAKWLKQDE